MTDLEKAIALLERCDKGFSAFIMGRKLARKERDKLRSDIQELLGKVGCQPDADSPTLVAECGHKTGFDTSQAR